MEKRSSTHESLVLRQQELQTSNQQTTTTSEEGAKWILEPLVLCPLDPTIFFRKELFEVCVHLDFIEEIFSLFLSEVQRCISI